MQAFEQALGAGTTNDNAGIKMRLFHGTDNAEIQRPTVLTLGVFDGLHLGHQLIMRTVVEQSARRRRGADCYHVRSSSARCLASRVSTAVTANVRSED